MTIVSHDPTVGSAAKEATLGECLPGGIVDDDIPTEAGSLHKSGQSIATSHDLGPQKVAFWKGNPRLFQGNPGW